ncbi:hypothetical protein ECHLIB_0192 [Ehrlichia chaffeensis str. Liberty]|uniref:hypothetical protein n=1 Tax=Ehrlichia chaffeensis TaxID=945 RepID=UPI000444BAD2|nr:hypothetical protein [Ehrlichia chaffeensis]AHX05283.1 hypothetical protein ECHJAX_0195 [Ehrlichia chaffeensis str. Jax]AHX06271.1 hypothetical protein ECHLIB_0192 [Ehrlichia chaffeensis str. Liberty]AHX07187.1 hypothetical protein ECHOSC_0865 [Ehrlichia chaffeensis str. Osceola]
MCLRIKNKKLASVLEQIRMTCLLIYTIGAILLLLKHYDAIGNNLDVASDCLISVSAMLFLMLFFVKLIDCIVESKNHYVQPLEGSDHSHFVQNTRDSGRINGITIVRYISNVLFATTCVMTCVFLLLSKHVNKPLLPDIYSAILMVGISLAGLYFSVRFLTAVCGICSNFTDNMNTRFTKCEAVNFIVGEIYTQPSMSLFGVA